LEWWPFHVNSSSQGLRDHVAAWDASGDPLDLWPDLDHDDLQRAHRLIATVSGHAISGSGVPPDLHVDREQGVRATGIAAFQSGVGPLLGYWIERGVVGADPQLSSPLARHLAHGRKRAATFTTALGKILAAFDEVRVVPTVLKGTLTSRRYFPEPGTRPMADIDLLVAPSDITAAQNALSAAGLSRFAVSPNGESQWCVTGTVREVHSVELDHELNPWAVDLHTTIDRRYFRGLWARFADFPFTQASPTTLEGFPARVLGQPLLAAHLAQHASRGIHLFQLIRLIELILVLEQDVASGALKWEALAALLADTGLSRFVFPAFELAARLAPEVVDEGFRLELAAHATPRMQRTVDYLAKSGMWFGSRRSLDEMLMWACGPGELSRNLGELVWPGGVPWRSRARALRRRISILTRGRIRWVAD
jgi:hypothetical protein